MTAIPAEKLDRLIERWNVLQTELNQGVNQAARVQLAREFSELNPVVGASDRLINRSVIVFSNTVNSMFVRLPNSVASKPPSISRCRSGCKSPAPPDVLWANVPRPSIWLEPRLVNLSPYLGWLPDCPNAARSLSSSTGRGMPTSRYEADALG